MFPKRLSLPISSLVVEFPLAHIFCFFILNQRMSKLAHRNRGDCVHGTLRLLLLMPFALLSCLWRSALKREIWKKKKKTLKKGKMRAKRLNCHCFGRSEPRSRRLSVLKEIDAKQKLITGSHLAIETGCQSCQHQHQHKQEQPKQ